MTAGSGRRKKGVRNLAATLVLRAEVLTYTASGLPEHRRYQAGDAVRRQSFSPLPLGSADPNPAQAAAICS